MRRIAPWLAVLGVACGKKSGPSPWDLSQPVPAGGARAGLTVKATDLVGGPRSRAHLGDFKIYNSKVRFIIGAAGPSSGYEAYGGNIAAADLVRTDGSDQSYFGEVIHGLGFRAINADTVEVVRDGSAGGAAELRVTAHDDILPIIEAYLGQKNQPAFQPLDLAIVVDYVLEPDSSALQVTTTFKTVHGEAVSVGSTQFALLFGDGAARYIDGQGFTDNPASGTAAFYAGVAPTVSYSILPYGPTMSFLGGFLGIAYADLGAVNLAAGAEGHQVFYVGVGDGDVSSLLHVHDSIRSLGRAPISGQVVDPSGQPVVGARVHMTLADGTYLDFARTQSDGTFDGLVPTGPVQIQAVADGRAPSSPTTLSVPASGLSGTQIQLAAPAALQVKVSESGQAIPAKVMFFQQSGSSPSYPPNFGEVTNPGGASAMIFARPVTETVPLTAGTYRVVAMRGFEYDTDEQVVTVSPGQAGSAAFTLHRVVDTTGYLSGDFHIHSAPSPDSDDLVTIKALSFAAEGLEVPVSTDHDFIFDYQPVIDSLGLTPFVRSIIGEEVSTTAYGHFNVFPCQILDQPNNGAVKWLFQNAADLFTTMRSNPAGPLVQVNHPRSTGMGYFESIGFNPATFTASRGPNELVTSFDAIEVLNGKSVAMTTSQIMPDWFSFLNRGYHVVGNGNSDSHRSLSAEIGTPRNFVQVGVDDPAQLNPANFVAAVKAGRVSVSGGPFITLSINGKGLGEMAALDAQSHVNAAVTVQAPTWMGPIETLQLIRNGQVLQTVTLTAADADPANPVMRFRGTLTDAPTADAWYLVEVISTGGNLGPVDSTRPFAFTNPIWVDADGNGAFDPPLR